MNHGLDGLGLYGLFNSISVISGRWKDTHEGICAMKRRLGSERTSPLAEFETENPWSEDGSANHRLWMVSSKTSGENIRHWDIGLNDVRQVNAGLPDQRQGVRRQPTKPTEIFLCLWVFEENNVGK